MNEWIEKILDEIEARSAGITGVREPAAGAGGSEILERLAEIDRVRGRPLVYSFLGSGRGRGALVELEDGSVKWDFITGIGTYFFGHGDRRMTRVAIRSALSDIAIQGHLQPNREYHQFLSAVSAIAPGRCRHVWPSMSGSMANENALKMIRLKKMPAWRVLVFSGAFAGRTAVLSELSENGLNKKGQPEFGQAVRIPFYDASNASSTDRTISAIREAVAGMPGEICAIHVELVQGEGGYRTAPAEFFRAVFEECRSNGIAVWVDEVQTFGRTGEYFMLDRLGLADFADVVTIGKMACGSAVLFTPEYNPEPGLISGTFAGYTAGLALGSEVIARLKDEGHLGPGGNIRRIEKEMTVRFERLREMGLIQDHTVVGGMAAATPARSDQASVRSLVQELFRLGLCAFWAGHGPYRLRFLPPVGCLTPGDLDEPFRILEEGLRA